MEDRKILIVDDESPILRLLERTVKKIGCQTVCAFSAEEARTAIEAQSFDLLLKRNQYKKPNSQIGTLIISVIG